MPTNYIFCAHAIIYQPMNMTLIDEVEGRLTLVIHWKNKKIKINENKKNTAEKKV